MSEVKIQAPITLEMEVFIINDDTNQKGKLSVGLGALCYTNEEKIKERLNGLIGSELEEYAPGFRLMNADESVSFIASEKTGGHINLSAPKKDWDF